MAAASPSTTSYPAPTVPPGGARGEGGGPLTPPRRPARGPRPPAGGGRGPPLRPGPGHVVPPPPRGDELGGRPNPLDHLRRRSHALARLAPGTPPPRAPAPCPPTPPPPGG